MKKIIGTIGLLIIILAAGYVMHITSAPTDPSHTIQDAQSQINTASTKQEVVQRTYRISSADSSASFRIGEILRDKPFTAVGVTHEIAGDISVVVNKESGAEHLVFDDIVINAKTFKTDSEKRDGAIARMILKAEDPANEYIVFKTMAVGLPDAPAPSVATPFSVTGNLTIAGVTKPVTFTGSITMTDTQLSGTVSADIKRSEFQLAVPNIPFVAEVDDMFTITATIVAKKV